MILSPSDVEAMDGRQLVNALCSYTSELMQGASCEDDDRRLEWLPRAAQVLHLLMELDFEVMQGGLNAYFLNSSGRHAALAEEALGDIGAHAMAEVLGEARRVYASAERQWVERQGKLAAENTVYSVVHPYKELDGAEDLVALTERYRLACDSSQPHWGDLLERFLLAHRESLAAHLRSVGRTDPRLPPDLG